MLRVADLTKVYRNSGKEVRAVDGASLEVSSGELVTVQGASGCGKTTLLLIAGALLAPDSGEVTVAGRNPYAMAPEARARFRAKNVGFVFQQFHLVPYLTVLDNVLAPSLAKPAADARRRAEELIEHFGLAPRARHVPAELSTGERQRAALARALLNRPPLVLADEPSGNLDDASAEAVLGYLAEFAAGGGAVLLVSHDPRAAKYARRVLRMQDGKLLGA